MVVKWTGPNRCCAVPTGPSSTLSLARYAIHMRHIASCCHTSHRTWLDTTVFYLASAEYDIGIFIIFIHGPDSWHCRRMGRNKECTCSGAFGAWCRYQDTSWMAAISAVRPCTSAVMPSTSSA